MGRFCPNCLNSSFLVSFFFFLPFFPQHTGCQNRTKIASWWWQNKQIYLHAVHTKNHCHIFYVLAAGRSCSSVFSTTLKLNRFLGNELSIRGSLSAVQTCWHKSYISWIIQKLAFLKLCFAQVFSWLDFNYFSVVEVQNQHLKTVSLLIIEHRKSG